MTNEPSAAINNTHIDCSSAEVIAVATGAADKSFHLIDPTSLLVA